MQYIFGAGAQGRVALAVWRRMQPNAELAFVDGNSDLVGTRIHEVPILETAAILSLPKKPVVHVALGHNAMRLYLANRYAQLFDFQNVVDPSAVITLAACLGRGVFVGPLAVIHTSAVVEDFTIINTAAIVEHDVIVRKGASVSPGVRMAGRVEIGEGSFIGTGATLLSRVKIGEATVIGAGSVVVHDIPSGVVAYGNPAKVIRKVTDDDWGKLF